MIKLECVHNGVVSTVSINETVDCGDVVQKMAAFLVLAGFHNDTVADALLAVSNDMTPDEEDHAISNLVRDAQELNMGYDDSSQVRPENFDFLDAQERRDRLAQELEKDL